MRQGDLCQFKKTIHYHLRIEYKVNSHNSKIKIQLIPLQFIVMVYRLQRNMTYQKPSETKL